MLTPYHTTNRTATTNGPISLAYAAGLGKYGYGNGIAVTERISGTVLNTYCLVSNVVRNKDSSRYTFHYRKSITITVLS